MAIIRLVPNCPIISTDCHSIFISVAQSPTVQQKNLNIGNSGSASLRKTFSVIHSVKTKIRIAKINTAITDFTSFHLSSSRCPRNDMLFSFSSTIGSKSTIFLYSGSISGTLAQTFRLSNPTFLTDRLLSFSILCFDLQLLLQ